jgi:hypothetical protein
LEGEAPPAAPAVSADDARAKLVAAGVQFLEALAEVLAAEKPAAPPELVQRGTAALHAILRAVGGPPATDALE